MKRLSELPAEDHVMARTHVLIRAMGPTLDSEERRRPVRRSLDAPVALPRRACREASILLDRGAPLTALLAEEVLALQMEALLARGNACQPQLAFAYLAQCPSGRYRELAKLALASSKQ